MVQPDIQYVVIKALSAVVAAKLAQLAYHAYKRTDEKALGILAFGFTCFVVGSGIAVGLSFFMGIQRGVVIAESTLTLIGLVIIGYSALRR